MSKNKQGQKLFVKRVTFKKTGTDDVSPSKSADKKAYENLLLKDGRPVRDLKPLEAALIHLRHHNPDHPDFNPEGRTAGSAGTVAQLALEEWFQQTLPKARQVAKEVIEKRSKEFQHAVKAQVSSDYALSTEWHFDEIKKMIDDDNHRIKKAVAAGRPWEDEDPKFPRKDLKGNPYSDRKIREEIRLVRKAYQKEQEEKSA